jgi:late competence protein required for DNA uptake (superfamily II DNA/RNA helicase)
MTHFENLITMREASNGHLACLFSAPDIVYGTNMSLINVFIGSGYGFNATRNSLYQLIGRAGRTGRSNKARILFEDHHTMKRALLPEPNGKNFEADVMDWHLRRKLRK